MSYRITQDVGLTLWYHNRTRVSDQTIISCISIDVTAKADAPTYFYLSAIPLYFILRNMKRTEITFKLSQNDKKNHVTYS